jgi:hypothetical protein
VGGESRLLRRIAVAIAVALAAAISAGCGRGDEAPPSDAVWLVMRNETGQHLTKFVLDHETGRIEYQIFSRGYTFASWVTVTRDLPVRGSFYDEAGVQREFAAERPIPPALVGGRYVITFEPEGRTSLVADWPD